MVVHYKVESRHHPRTRSTYPPGPNTLPLLKRGGKGRSWGWLPKLHNSRHFWLPRALEPGIRINLLILHCNILRSQVAYPPLGSPEHLCFYTLGWKFPLWVLFVPWQDFCGWWPREWWLWLLGKEHFCSARLGRVVVMNLDVGVDGQITYPG